jgi:hypothetical protein
VNVRVGTFHQSDDPPYPQDVAARGEARVKRERAAALTVAEVMRETLFVVGWVLQGVHQKPHHGVVEFEKEARFSLYTRRLAGSRVENQAL